MKRTIFTFGILIFILFLVVNIYAQETKSEPKDPKYSIDIDVDKINYQNTPINKLFRGIVNTGTCWVEVPAGIYDMSNKKGAILGWTLGIATGTITGLMRGITGILDVVSFISPPYNKPWMKPEYALENFGNKMREYPGEFLPDLTP